MRILILNLSFNAVQALALTLLSSDAYYTPEYFNHCLKLSIGLFETYVDPEETEEEDTSALLETPPPSP
ncbi:MAG: hypothetical protein ACJAZS_000067 [Alteromonas naphthalenivorans]|jgi:hypothetical protein